MISSTLSHPSRNAISSKPLIKQLLDARLIPLVGFCLLFFMAAGSLVDVNLNDDVVNLDIQLLVKLAVAASASLYGGYGFLTDGRIRKLLFSPPGLWLLIVATVYVATALTGINKVTAIVASSVLLGAIMAMTTFCVWHGRLAGMRLVFRAVALFVLGSWVAYILFPSYAIFQEPLPGGVFLERMAGLSHPNTLGQFSALAIILGAVRLRCDQCNRRFVYFVMFAALVALIMSISRTSTAAALAGLALVYRDYLFRKSMYVLALIGVVLGSAGLVIGTTCYDFDQKIEEKIAGMLLKSSESSSDELTTATGRSAIWAKSISLIKQRPMTGWGAGSSKVLLKDYTRYTHNLFLNVFLSTGILGGIGIVTLMLVMLSKAIFRPSIVPDAIIVFIVLNGMMENVIFSNVPSAPTLILVVAVLWRSLPLVVPEHKELEADTQFESFA